MFWFALYRDVAFHIDADVDDDNVDNFADVDVTNVDRIVVANSRNYTTLACNVF